MKLLHVIHSMDPARGGLAAYLNAIVPALAELGHESEIVTLDRAGAPFLTALSAPTHALGPARLGYGYSPPLRRWLQVERDRFDAVIVHGLWQYQGMAVQRALSGQTRIRYFVFAHGMLDPWFKRTYPLKHLKKWCYWQLAERRVLRDAAAVVFTADEERRLARESFGAGHYVEKVVTFGTAAPAGDPEAQREAFLRRHPELRHRPFWLFLGRIHPKKGIDLLLEAHADLCRRSPATPPLVIAGPCATPGYLESLQRIAHRSDNPAAVIWPGMLVGDEKWGALRAAEVFVLPSHQENFGIALVEALACGTPALISNQVNIWREVVEDNAGWAEPDTLAGVTRLLARWQSLDTTQREQMRHAAAQSFSARYEISAVARSLAALLEESPENQTSVSLAS
jgi:glycosyltransferase involved in cell wall biosynthesis